MTTGEYLSSISTVSDVAAITHFMNISTVALDITKIKSYKILHDKEITNVYVMKPTYKLVFPKQEYKVAYQPSPVALTRVTENVIITKGC